MNQTEKRLFLINELLKERSEYNNISIPENSVEQKKLLRSLMNVRPPKPISPEFLKIQDEYLKQAVFEKGITKLSELSPIKDDLFVWQGDITTLECDAIVNAGNSQLLGCFRPLHNCIDNCIHTYSGVQLRILCNEIMESQGYEEPVGKAKITPAFNLPCKYVIHTVGPFVQGKLTDNHRNLLRSCYMSCLKIADEYKAESIAFCCISTGVFMFPNNEAGKIAVDTVKSYKSETKSKIKVIFNVFKDIDFNLYKNLLENI